MSIKVVFFDMMGTLAHFAPQAEDLLVEAAAEHGIALTQHAARRGFALAGEWWNRQMARRSLLRQSDEEKDALYTAFDQRVLREAGLEVEPQVARGLMDAVMRNSGNARLTVYDDAAPALS